MSLHEVFTKTVEFETEACYI